MVRGVVVDVGFGDDDDGDGDDDVVADVVVNAAELNETIDVGDDVNGKIGICVRFGVLKTLVMITTSISMPWD